MRFIALAAAAAAFLAPMAANAAVSSFTCANTDISPTAVSCTSVAGNIFSSSSADETAQVTALGLLGLTYTHPEQFDFSSYVQILGGSNPYSKDGLTFTGDTYVGIRYNEKGDLQSVFYKFNAGTPITEFTGNLKGFSNAYFYATNVVGSVPEPTTWAMMALGLAGVGAALRQRRRQSAQQGALVAA